ncbi:MAG: hypothetical protein QOH79_2162 [Acidimicrobiaceae bacterium]
MAGGLVPDGCAVVTGASRGLGRAIALELAGRGTEVVATMRDPAHGAPLLRESAARDLPLRVQRLDVTQPGDFEMPDGLTMLVNNAGIRKQYLSVEDTDLSEWRETFETNVFGAVEMTRRAIPKLRATGGGVICNITSMAIFQPWPFFAAYRASKAALATMTESLSIELAPHGIRVIDVPLGPVETDLWATSIIARPPEAVEHEAYREVAERNYEQIRQAMPQVTSTADAARGIVDALFDTSDAARVACDVVAAEALAKWRSCDDEARRRDMLHHLGLDG